MESGSSTYMLLFRETSPERYEAMSADERRHCLGRWNDWCESLAARGKLQHGHPLEPTGRVVATTRDRRALDGPFAEAKELIGGYFMLTAASLDEATAIAEQCPNLEYGMVIEVRPVAGVCHLARSLGWQTMREPVGA